MKESTYNYFDTSNNCLWPCRHSKSTPFATSTLGDCNLDLVFDSR